MGRNDRATRVGLAGESSTGKEAFWNCYVVCCSGVMFVMFSTEAFKCGYAMNLVIQVNLISALQNNYVPCM